MLIYRNTGEDFGKTGNLLFTTVINMIVANIHKQNLPKSYDRADEPYLA
jgi:hypothetical protein